MISSVIWIYAKKSVFYSFQTNALIAVLKIFLNINTLKNFKLPFVINDKYIWFFLGGVGGWISRQEKDWLGLICGEIFKKGCAAVSC